MPGESKVRSGVPSLRILAVLLAFLAVAHWVSFTPALWLLALLSFSGLREYLSLTDLRPEDRWAMLAAYLSVPFLFYLVQIDWYGFFIVSIPVYVFVIVPFLVALGGRDPLGSVFSAGAIDFGLFLFVYCLGHLAYLARASTALALWLVLGVMVCDLIDRQVSRLGGGWPLKLAIAVLPVFALALVLGRPDDLPRAQAAFIAALLPILVLMGNFTLSVMETDLGIDPGELEPGRGRLIDGMRPLLFAAPVVFHVLRYFTDIL
jgi:phosphatidate cytidylyltransferase